MSNEVLTKQESELVGKLRNFDWGSVLSFGQVVVQIREGQVYNVHIDKTILIKK